MRLIPRLYVRRAYSDGEHLRVIPARIYYDYRVRSRSEPVMQPLPGTYALILHGDSNTSIQVGRLGRLEIQRGYYIYVGSAFGPGGVRARVLRHYRRQKTKHWHIDYLRESVEFDSVWYSHAARKLEHEWANILLHMQGLSPVDGFGCSDCRCRAHLFRSPTKPVFKRFSQATGGCIKTWRGNT